MTNIFYGNINVIGININHENDDNLKSFLKHQFDNIITDTFSLYRVYELKQKNITIINNHNYIEKVLKQKENKIIFIDVYLQMTNKDLKKLLINIRQISEKNNLKIVLIGLTFKTPNNNISNINNILMYMVDNIFIYNKNVFSNVKDRYNTNQKIYNIINFKRKIRIKKLKRILK